MANQGPIAHAAGAFEQLARAVRDGTRAWDDATRQLATRAVDDLKIFVRKVRDWTDSDTAKANDLAAQLEGVTGRPSRPIRAPAADGPDAGTRAFIAREVASLGTVLDQAAKALHRSAGNASDAVQSVLEVMQPLRGLATLSDLPPMPDLLEGIERTVGEATRADPSPLAGDTLDAAARALAHVARQVAAEGRADPDAEPVREFATLLHRLLGLDATVGPIEDLYYAGARRYSGYYRTHPHRYAYRTGENRLFVLSPELPFHRTRRSRLP